MSNSKSVKLCNTNCISIITHVDFKHWQVALEDKYWSQYFQKFEFSISSFLLFAQIDNVLVTFVELGTKSPFDENFLINGIALMEKELDCLSVGVLIKIYMYSFVFPSNLRVSLGPREYFWPKDSEQKRCWSLQGWVI